MSTIAHSPSVGHQLRGRAWIAITAIAALAAIAATVVLLAFPGSSATTATTVRHASSALAAPPVKYHGPGAVPASAPAATQPQPRAAAPALPRVPLQ